MTKFENEYISKDQKNFQVVKIFNIIQHIIYNYAKSIQIVNEARSESWN